MSGPSSSSWSRRTNIRRAGEAMSSSSTPRETLPTARSAPTPATSSRPLTAPEFHLLAQVPPATEWFANIINANTRRAYRNDLQEFMAFVGIGSSDELRLVTRAHFLAWRKDLERRKLAGSTMRRKLSALSSLFEYLSNGNAVTHNPVKGVRRPQVESYEGKTPALGDSQARHLLKLPAGDELKDRRDRALLSLVLHHGLRRQELSGLKVHDIHLRRGVPHLRARQGLEGAEHSAASGHAGAARGLPGGLRPRPGEGRSLLSADPQ